jgi:hypothetical protein
MASKKSKSRRRRGAAILLVLILSSVMLIAFNGTFQTYRILQNRNRETLKELQLRANTIRVIRSKRQ